jgi:hypothetical protein
MLMAQGGGGPQSEEAVRKAVRAMRGMSDAQVAAVARAASVLSVVAAKLRAARDYLAGRAFLQLAIAALILAVLLRWLGWA